MIGKEVELWIYNKRIGNGSPKYEGVESWILRVDQGAESSIY